MHTRVAPWIPAGSLLIALVFSACSVAGFEQQAVDFAVDIKTEAALVKIDVRWDDATGAPTADDVNVGIKHGQTPLQWTGDESIASITGIDGLSSGEFTAPQSSSAKVWTATDKCTQKGDFPYTITGTKADGTAGMSDPKITNDDE